LKILLTSTSFQDTSGKHHDALNNTGFDVDKLRGPLKETILLPVIADYDGLICGDDEITSNVIKAGAEGRLKVISKYGIGLDKIDLIAADKVGIPVTNCPGVNHIAVAEHVFALLLAYYKNIHLEYNYTQNGQWTRLIGEEIYNKKIGIIGLGRIGKEVAKRAYIFGLKIFAYDIYFDQDFIDKYEIKILSSIEEAFSTCDIISLHMNLTEDNKNVISDNTFKIKGAKQVVLVNTARGDLVEINALLEALDKNYIKAYLTDVLDEEPMSENNPLQYKKNVLITPHIGSRTFESVERQGIMSVKNLLKHIYD
jgi:D-3-phosphoglycerate dehydrogenase / 2-oxoglutarate reductase